jgi:hypothetical protein
LSGTERFLQPVIAVDRVRYVGEPVASTAPGNQARSRAASVRRRLPTLVFLLYQKGRDSRISQAQDRAIDDFTLKGICAAGGALAPIQTSTGSAGRSARLASATRNLDVLDRDALLSLVVQPHYFARHAEQCLQLPHCAMRLCQRR